MLGAGVASEEPLPGTYAFHQHLPDFLRMGMWWITGALAVVIAFRPSGRSGDAIAWAALYLMPAVRFISYFMAWVDSMSPYGTIGHPRGWVSGTVYLCIMLTIYTCSGWPEPVPPGRLTRVRDKGDEEGMRRG